MPAHLKDPSVRARTNKASTRATLAPLTAAEKRKGPPELGRTFDVEGNETVWHPAVEAWWADAWSSPMSRQWATSDVHGLRILAQLMQDFHTARSASARKEAATEIRLQRQAFGLTPMDRRRLEWTIASADEATTRASSRRTAAKGAGKQSATTATGGARQPRGSSDPRLTLVSG